MIIKLYQKTLDNEYSEHPGYIYWKALAKKGAMANDALIKWANEMLVELKN